MPLPDYLPGRFALARGRPGDYFDLEHFHYLPRRPATYADVWVVRYAESRDSASRDPVLSFDVRCSKFDVRRSSSNQEMRTPNIEHRTPNIEVGMKASTRFDVASAVHDALEARWRCAARHDDARSEKRGTVPLFRGQRLEVFLPVASSRVVAVGVLSFPSFRSRPRERVLGLRDLSHKDRLRFANAHVRTISRVVVHPQFRSLGLASELVRTLIAHCPTRYVEASAVMARVHPFFAAAGMRAVNADEPHRPAYFIVDKEEGLPCASETETK